VARSILRSVRILRTSSVTALVLCFVLQFFTAASVLAQNTGVIQGTVRAAESGAPLPGVTIVVEEIGLATRSDSRGNFQLVAVPLGTHQVVARRLGLETERVQAVVSAGATARVEFTLSDQALLMPAVVVSATRETQRLSETAASVGIISSEELRLAKPTHPSTILGQIPGVWVNVTGGEGHMTAIRQPQTTKPVYLFLEDGVPTRSTGFFNHNALYEINLPQAERVEVLKGPATALYGSDAIGGVINVESRRPSVFPSAEAYLEGGAFGYNRLLASGSAGGLRADLNLTRTDGWRDATGYDRQSATLRWDAQIRDGAALKTVFTASRIDQQTAGTSALPRQEYVERPTSNLTPISLRQVRAARFSTALELQGDNTLFSVTPYVRWNEMEMLPNWTLTFDPHIGTSGHRSAGVLTRARLDLPELRARVIGGVDIDRSPGSRVETRIDVVRTGSAFTGYTTGDVIYDYDVTFQSVSPYVQADLQPVESLHLTAGLRFDHMSYDYDSRLAPIATGRWRVPEDAVRSYTHLSPKLGASYDFGRQLNVYGNYNRGFRAPSEGQLFRQGSALNTVDLSPVTADSYELGLRGELAGRFGYTLAAYTMEVDSDILNFVRADGSTEAQNAGATRHRGVEAGLSVLLHEAARAHLSYSRAKHTYVSWQPRPTLDFSGNEMEAAPNTILNGRLALSPALIGAGIVSLEWNRIGEYWMNPENTHRYQGHDLFNVHASIPMPRGIEIVGRVMNIADTRYAEMSSFTQARGEELAPGMPRTLFLGAQYRWQR
jgi:iron complex outermembrane recepter protein